MPTLTSCFLKGKGNWKGARLCAFNFSPLIYLWADSPCTWKGAEEGPQRIRGSYYCNGNHPRGKASLGREVSSTSRTAWKEAFSIPQLCSPPLQPSPCLWASSTEPENEPHHEETGVQETGSSKDIRSVLHILLSCLEPEVPTRWFPLVDTILCFGGHLLSPNPSSLLDTPPHTQLYFFHRPSDLNVLPT